MPLENTPCSLKEILSLCASVSYILESWLLRECFCVWKVNTLTIPNAFPLSRLHVLFVACHYWINQVTVMIIGHSSSLGEHVLHGVFLGFKRASVARCVCVCPHFIFSCIRFENFRAVGGVEGSNDNRVGCSIHLTPCVQKNSKQMHSRLSLDLHRDFFLPRGH